MYFCPIWKKVAPIFDFFQNVAILYICARARTTSLPKKHQDMEVNNIQETQHRAAQQMRVDEFAAMLGQVQKPRDV